MPVSGAQICPFYVSVFEIAVIKQERNAIWEGLFIHLILLILVIITEFRELQDI